MSDALLSFSAFPCRHREPGREGQERLACLSPKIVAPNGVTAKVCAGCYCRDHEPVSPGQERRLKALAARGDKPRGSLADLIKARRE